MCFRGCKPGLYVPCMLGDTRLPRPVHVRNIPPREANTEFMHAERICVFRMTPECFAIVYKIKFYESNAKISWSAIKLII